MFVVVVAVILLLIAVNGLYVAAEFATVSARRTKIGQLAGQGDRMAQALLPIVEDRQRLDRYVAACQIGITISSLVLGAYAQSRIAARITPAVAQLLAGLGLTENPNVASTAAASLSVILVLIGVTGLQVILGELFPKSVAIQFPERVATAVVWPMKVSLQLFSPLIWLFNGSAVALLRLLGRSATETAPQAHTPEEIELMMTDSHEGGLLDDTERRLLRNAFRMRDLTARQVMVHRTKIEAAPLETGVRELLESAIEAGYSRIPVYRETIDNIVGFVHIKDIFRLYINGESDLSTILREAVYVPDTLPINDVWERLNEHGQYLAVVFDEFGGTAGLITFEDLIEEIFGELQDEFDDEMAVIARDKEGRIYLRGDLLISDVNEYLELDLPTESADTLSGLVFSALGRPPQTGDEVQFGDVAVHVETMDDLGVGEVSLLLPPRDGDAAAPFGEWDIEEHD